MNTNSLLGLINLHARYFHGRRRGFRLTTLKRALKLIGLEKLDDPEDMESLYKACVKVSKPKVSSVKIEERKDYYLRGLSDYFSADVSIRSYVLKGLLTGRLVARIPTIRYILENDTKDKSTKIQEALEVIMPNAF